MARFSKAGIAQIAKLEQAGILKAFLDDRPLQWRYNEAYVSKMKAINASNFKDGNWWCDWTGSELVTDAIYEYRVKPEPKTVYVIRNGNGVLYTPHADKDHAERELDRLKKDGGIKPYTLEEYRQVLPE